MSSRRKDDEVPAEYDSRKLGKGVRGKYYQRVRAQVPADFVQPGTAQTARPLVAGDVVNVRVIAGSQQQRFSYRVVSTRPANGQKRVLVVAAEDYKGLSPNKTAYDTAPRYQ